MTLTDDEIQELEILLRYQELDIESDNTNPNFTYLKKCLKEQKFDDNDKLISGKAGVALEGSSRSGKTWSCVDLIIYICTFIETDCTINLYRQTYNEFKTTIYDDFKRRLDDYGLENPFRWKDEVKSFKIGNNKIHFLGDGKHGGGCDYAYFNEIMMISQEVFDQVEMRCRKFWFADYNPSYTDHWFFDNVLNRSDVGFLRTTYKQNPFISKPEKNKIESWEPWLPGSYEVTLEGDLLYNGKPIDSNNQPPPHPENIKNGTHDEFNWKVYGLGLRGAMKGVIFPHINWIDKFPDIAYTYANDFGFTADPNVLGRYAEDETDIYIEPLSYQPIETDEELSAFMESVGVEKHLPVVCDSSDKYTGENKGTIEMVKGLRKRGFNASKVKKTKSVMYWILSMKQKRINVVKNHLWKEIKKEKENYKFKEVNGILINQPIDKHNHFWDMARYGHISHNSEDEKVYTTKPDVLKSINY